MNNLIKTRNFLKLTQKELADLIEVPRSTYSDYEKNRFDPPIEKLNMIANKYELSLDYLLDLTNDYSNKIEKRNINKKKIGKILKDLRKKNNLNQNQLAKKINTYQSRISNYEQGKGITIKLLKKYAIFFEKTIDYLCGKTKQ